MDEASKRAAGAFQRTTGALSGVWAGASAGLWVASAVGIVAPPAAAALGVAAAYAAVGAAAFGALSLMGGWLAECPPRIDFTEVTRFERIDLGLREPNNEVVAALQNFLTEQLNLRQASNAFLMSLERQQGAECVLKGQIGSDQDRQQAGEFEPLQREAITQNVEACAELHTNSLDLATTGNNAWREFRRVNLAPGATLQIKNVQEAKDALRQAREALNEAKEEYRLVEFGVTDFTEVERAYDHPTTIAKLPETLIYQDWFERTRRVREIDFEEGVGDAREPGIPVTRAILEIRVLEGRFPGS
jgi:hypothetical protein